MAKKLLKNLRYLENEISIQDEIKRIFHHIYRAFRQANEIIFLEVKCNNLAEKLVYFFLILWGFCLCPPTPYELHAKILPNERRC